MISLRAYEPLNTIPTAGNNFPNLQTTSPQDGNDPSPFASSNRVHSSMLQGH